MIPEEEAQIIDILNNWLGHNSQHDKIASKIYREVVRKAKDKAALEEGEWHYFLNSED
tara:strand:+ start:447 stop:620 length:174 start_codon:yes stop_codon:yes gene_type:complete